MKIRAGFVSNSSSSSFMCDVTGEMFSGMDMSKSEFDLSSCINEHTFMDEYVVELENEFEAKRLYVIKGLEHIRDSKWYQEKYPEDVVKAQNNLEILTTINEEDFEELMESEEFRYALSDWDEVLPEEACPICTLQHPTDKMVMEYLLSVVNKSRGTLTEEIQEKFNGYDEFEIVAKEYRAIEN